MRRLGLAAAVVVLAGCAGRVPERDGPPEQAISAILVAGRFILPTGETRVGETWINFESGGGRQAEIYRLPVTGGDSQLFLVEPGTYRIAPTRSFFGFHRSRLRAKIEGRWYSIPFPRELLRVSPFEVKPGKIAPLGVVEVRVQKALPGQRPTVKVVLDDSVEARRDLVQATIRDMMDPRRTSSVRESAIAWSRSLERSLLELLAEAERRPTYKTGP